MDKKVFLLDKEAYTEEMVSRLTEKDLEEWFAEEGYDDDFTIKPQESPTDLSVE